MASGGIGGGVSVTRQSRNCRLTVFLCLPLLIGEEMSLTPFARLSGLILLVGS